MYPDISLDRVLISDRQPFSGFFKYNIKNGQMIGYYIINDPKTSAHGMTLRFAIAGFFYQTETDALKKETKVLIIAHKTYRSDPFDNVLSRHLGSGNTHTSKSAKIEENIEKGNCEVIQGNTYCQVIYDSTNIFQV